MGDAKKRRWFHRDGQSSTTAPEPFFAPEPDAARPEPSADDVAGMLARLTDYVYVQVRSGVYDVPALRELTLQAAASETADPERADEIARQALSRELQEWHEDAARWGPRTDCDRLDAAFAALDHQGILALPGLLDEQSLAESVRVRSSGSGCVAYLVADIWRAIDSNYLVLTVLDADGEPTERNSPLERTVIDTLVEGGLLGTAGATDGQVEVAMVWRRRPPE